MNFDKVSSRQLNRSQRNRLASIVRWYRAYNAYSGVTSIRFKLHDCKAFISLTLTTRRSDCSKFSPRQIITQQRVHAFIGPRGGCKVMDATSGLTSEKAFIQRMI